MINHYCPLQNAARRHADRLALLDGDTQFTYGQLDHLVDQLIVRLRAEKVDYGQRIAVQSDNSWQLVTLIWALLRMGVVTCLISQRWPASNVSDTLLSIEAERLFQADELQEFVRPLHRRAVVLDSGYRQTGDLATVVFSSGSTGQAKAVGHDLAAHLANADGSNQNLSLQPNDRWLLALPLYHVAGLGIMFRCALAGATAVIPRTSDSVEQAIGESCISHLSLVPVQLKRLLAGQRQPLRHLKAILLGGAPIPMDLVQAAIDEGWPIYPTYGLSEMASQVTATGPTTPLAKRTTVGPALPGRELMLADDGEILVRGDTLFRGYLNDSGWELPLDHKGWFHTGDLGRLDDDAFLSVIGRKDNQFISGGENIYPEEVERLLQEIDGVDQAIVVAIADDEYGARPVAFVDSQTMAPDVWSRELARRIPRFKIPDHWFAWPGELTAATKANRGQLTRLAREKLKARIADDN